MLRPISAKCHRLGERISLSFRAKRGISLRRQHNVGYSFVGRKTYLVKARYIVPWCNLSRDYA